MIKLIPLKYGYWAYYNSHYIGDILCDIDGYYKWWPHNLNGPGYIDEHFLFSLCEKLGELNAPYDKELQNFFANCHQKPFSQELFENDSFQLEES